MNIFIDTAAFMAMLSASDQFHLMAKKVWGEILYADTSLYSSNYVLLETTALLQHRIGIEAVRVFEGDILPVIYIIWVDETIHNRAMSVLLSANRRNLSLVDCSSFELIRQLGIDSVFTFDSHFQELGIRVIPEPS